MRNKLSFSNMAFLMLLVGKIGHLGTLGGVPWLLVFIPFVLDILLDFFFAMGYYDRGIGWAVAWIKIRKLKKIANNIKKSNG